MTVVISPAKQMNFSTMVPGRTAPELTQPAFFEEACCLNEILKGFSVNDLADLMKLSVPLAKKTYDEIHRFGSPGNPKKAALFTYSGTVFQSMAAESFSSVERDFAGKHLRIFSGLYGILKPMDAIEPYRLEMKTPLQVPGSAGTLSACWRSRITDVLKKEKLILNLASDEYSKVLDKKQLEGDLISFNFKEETGASLRTVGMYAKKARGQMVRRIVGEQVCDPELLKRGDTGGYYFRSEYSSPDKWVFVRPSE